MQRPAFLLLIAALLIGCGGEPLPTAGEDVVPPLHPSVDDYGQARLDIDGVGIGVLVADTPAERRHGLMEVPELPDGTGMLFVYGEDRQGGFWMKDTLVPLSIAFVAADGTILEILDMEPCPPDGPCPSHGPQAPYRYALEVPQGWFAGEGLSPGAKLSGLPVDGASPS